MAQAHLRIWCERAPSRQCHVHTPRKNRHKNPVHKSIPGVAKATQRVEKIEVLPEARQEGRLQCPRCTSVTHSATSISEADDLFEQHCRFLPTRALSEGTELAGRGRFRVIDIDVSEGCDFRY